MRTPFLGFWIGWAWLLVPAATARGDGSAERLFALEVWPILKGKCLACHGDDPKKLKGGLDLRTRAALLAGGDTGAAIVPGKSAESLLQKAIRWDGLEMPPKANDRLSAAQVKTFADWIDGGAPWPDAVRMAAIVREAEKDRRAGERVKTSGGQSPEWTDRRYKSEDLWAFRPVVRPRVPAGGAGHPIDAFIGSQLDAAGLKPAPPADRRTLIRRATFDLTGLPPRPQEIADFLADPAPDAAAFATVVDRLLASPHYGEQMAQHWLDVARYADSSGLANDYERGNAWRYRDYVVRSFRNDKPYDQFIREQIAGDEIAPDDPEMLVAVGFLRMGAWELTGMEVARIARQRFLDDVTDAVGQVFLAQMLQCARCHDHKFDPVPTRDYYRLQAAFATTQLVEREAAFLPVENRAGFDEKKYLDRRRAALETELKRIREAENAARAKWAAENPEKRGEKPPRHQFLPAADLGLERIARKGLERLQWEYDRYAPVALSVYSGHTPNVKSVSAPFRMPKDILAGEREAGHVLPGGDPFAAGDVVTPGILSAAEPSPDALDWTRRLDLPETVSGRRRALAAWIASPRNPLTARVMANRIWQWTLGKPLAGNPNNFGATGRKPTHPELLDWLAAEFVAGKWSVKALQRQMLLSEVYRRASLHPDPAGLAARDPTGARYAVHPARRLRAEELRDALLAVSGELNPAIGGIPVRPEIHPDVANQPRQVMGTFAPAWEPSPRPEHRHRRTLYALKLRGVRDPFLDVFNAPSPEMPCEAREVSTVAPQAFALFNGAAVRARALAFAARLLKDTRTPDDTIRTAYRDALGREPSPEERKLCRDHWTTMTERHRALTFEKSKRPDRIARVAVEENTGEKFTFSERLPAAGDFVPDLQAADAAPDVRGLMEVCLVLFNTNEFLHVD